MPNWCNTYITFKGSQDKLQDFKNKLDEWTSHNAVENGFGLTWLGNVVINSGLITADEFNAEKCPRCRGWICDYSEEIPDNYLAMQTETAWSPMMKMWAMINEKYNFDFDITYEAEECGMGLYITNDPKVAETYVFDNWDNVMNLGSDYEMSEGELIKVLQILLNTTETNVDKLLNDFDESDLTDKMFIHKHEYVAIEELYDE